jgi:hypothetical protein
VEARLDEGQDVLALDDRAWAVHRRPETTAVTLVTSGNLFLETALSLFPHLQVTTIKEQEMARATSLPGSGTETPGSRSRSPKLTILDGTVPVTTTLPPGNLLFIAPPRSSDYFSVTGTVAQPMPRAVDGGDPLLAHVSLAGVGVLAAARVPLPAWARPVIVGETAAGAATPLLFAGEQDGRRIAVLAFDLRQSDLPLQVAFPLLMANLTGWLAPGSGGDLPGHLSPGAPLAFSLPREIAAVRITPPDGSTARLSTEEGQIAFADTAQLGVYEVEWDDGLSSERVRVTLAANLFSPQESDLAPAGTLAIQGREGEPTQEAVTSGPGAPRRARREWWRPLAFAALVLLSAEWLVYQRATLARMRRWLGMRLGRGE